MPDNKQNNRSAGDDDLMKAFYESLKALENVSDKDSGRSERKAPAPEKETPPVEEAVSPIDAHEYVDPEKQNSEVYDRMVSEIEDKRSQRRKSIWSDEPVIPVKKSYWLDDEPGAAEKPSEPEQVPEKPRRSKGLRRKEMEITVSNNVFRKEAPEQQEEPVSERVPAEEPVRRKAREEISRTETEEQEAAARRAAAEYREAARRARADYEEAPRRRYFDDAPAPEPAPVKRKKKPKYRKYETEFSFLNAAVCIVLVFGIGIALLVLKRDSGFIESENRNLAEFPEFSFSSYFSGDFTDGIMKYYTDTIPGRENLRAVSHKFTDLFGISTDDVEIINNQGSSAPQEKVDEEKKATTTKATVYTGPRETPATTEKPADSQGDVTTEKTTTEKITTREKVEVPNEGELINNVIVSGKGTPEVRAMSMFGGIFDIGTRYAQVLNSYKQMVGPTVNVYNMSVPLASAYYMPKNMEDMYSDQHECIENIGVSLQDVINVDVFDTLADHAAEYIYFRTDHHWQPLGAYYAAQQFAEAAQVPFPDLSTYEKKTIEDFTGSMYGYTNYLEDLKTYPDTLTYYKPANDYTVTYYDETFSNPYQGSLFFEDNEWTQNYSVILGGDDKIAEIETDVKNGRTLVLIKNSYGNALVPFFVGSFEKIYVVDFRYILVGMNDFFKRVGATDILFGMAIFSCYADAHVDMMQNIMY